MALLDQIQHNFEFMKSQLPLVLRIIGSLWFVHLLNILSRHKLSYLGILPRNPISLLGIVFSPLLHRDIQHLLTNSFPLFFLLNAMMIFGLHTLWIATFFITICSGLTIWLFGRRGIHIGASAVIYGYFGFVLASAYFTKNILVIATAAVCFFYFGSLIAGILPIDEETSWEGHLAGLIAGIACSCYLLMP